VAVRASPLIACELRHRLAFELSEVRLAIVGEDLRDWFSGARDDDRVDVDEFPSEPARRSVRPSFSR
jgi:hypothetical protein